MIVPAIKPDLAIKPEPVSPLEAEIRDDIVHGRRQRGIDASKEKRLNDKPNGFGQADILFIYEGTTWILEVKRSAIERRTYDPAYKGLGQVLHYLILAALHRDWPKARAALVFAGDMPSQSFVRACEQASVEVWEWRDGNLTSRSPSWHDLYEMLRARHPLGRQRRVASVV